MNDEESVRSEVAVLKFANQQLMEKMEKNTEISTKTNESLIELTSQIKVMIKLHNELHAKVDVIDGRVLELEKKDAASQSGRDLIKTAKNVAITVIVTGLLVAAGFNIKK